MAPSRRRKKLVQPALQLRLVGSFVGLGVLALLLQFLVLGARLTTLAAASDGTGGALADEVPRLLLEALAFSVAVLVPVLSMVGLVLTHRIVGPVQRIESYLRSVASGEERSPCRIRKGDSLQSLCDAVNLATEPLRDEEEAVQVELPSLAAERARRAAS